MKKFLLVLVFLFFGVCSAHAEQHALFTKILQTHVKDGLVDYLALCIDEEFPKYLEQLSAIDPKLLKTKEEKLSFWINVYNAFMLRAVCDEYPIKSVNQLNTGVPLISGLINMTIWDKSFFKINGKKMNLKHIEDKILRRELKEPRIHFAIVSGAMGCPPLRSEAYEAEKIYDQLKDQARIFLADESKNFFDPLHKVAYISPIFGWYKGDFGGRAHKVLIYAFPYMPKESQVKMKEDLRKWKVRFTNYDWHLNEQ